MIVERYKLPSDEKYPTEILMETMEDGKSDVYFIKLSKLKFHTSQYFHNNLTKGIIALEKFTDVNNIFMFL